jgi:WD40 repeat protein
MPDASGGFELWDWMEGIPQRSIEGEHPGESLRRTCEEVDYHPGAFSGDGQAWIWGKDVYDSSTLHGQSLTGKTWKLDSVKPLPSTWLEPSSPWAYGISPHTVELPNADLIKIDTRTGTIESMGNLPKDLTPGLYNQPSLPAISSDGKWLACHHSRAWLAVWSLPDGPCRAYQRRDYISHLEFSLNGSTLLTDGDGEWNWSGVPNPSNEPYPPLWSENPDGSAGGFGPDAVQEPKGQFSLKRRGEGIVEVFSLPENRLHRRLVAFQPNTCLVTFSSKSDLLLATLPMGEAWFWKRTGPVRKLPGSVADELIRPCYSPIKSGSRALAWSKDGAWTALGLDKGTVFASRAADLRIPKGVKADEKVTGKWKELGHLGSPIRSLSFSGSSLGALSQNGVASVWKLDGHGLVKEWKAHPHRANTLQLSTDGTICLTGGLDGISLWELPEAKLRIHGFDDRMGVACIHLHPTDPTLAAAAFLDGSIAVFCLSDLKIIWSTQAHKDVASSVAFHPSGKGLVSAGWDKTLQHWDAANGKCIASRDSILGGSLCWSPSGDCLAVATNASLSILDRDLRDLEGSSSMLDFYWAADCT